jgi:multiple sugar transport system permease protein
VSSSQVAEASGPAVIAMVPCIVVYVALQRYYVRGLLSGALKG